MTYAHFWTTLAKEHCLLWEHFLCKAQYLDTLVWFCSVLFLLSVFISVAKLTSDRLFAASKYSNKRVAAATTTTILQLLRAEKLRVRLLAEEPAFDPKQGQDYHILAATSGPAWAFQPPNHWTRSLPENTAVRLAPDNCNCTPGTILRHRGTWVIIITECIYNLPST